MFGFQKVFANKIKHWNVAIKHLFGVITEIQCFYIVFQ